MSSQDSLDPRKRIILQAVILEYVAEGEPVGSELLAQKYELGVRSATVRNELAEMSERGFLEQPHTSAGRIPSDVGYRYYVDHMIVQATPDPQVQKKVTDATHRSEILRSILQDTTKTLSRLSHQLAAATVTGDVNLRIRTAVLTALGPQKALLVLVFNNGDVENRMIECPSEMSLEDIGRLNEALPNMVSGLNIKALSKLKPTGSLGSASLDRLLAATIASIRTVGRDMAQGHLVVEGEEYVFAQPELQRDTSLLREVLRHLEDDEALSTAIQNNSRSPLLVTIGHENAEPGLRSLSILRHSFFIGDEEAGTLAIIGPTRQDYQTGISLLSFTARAIGETLAKILPK